MKYLSLLLVCLAPLATALAQPIPLVYDGENTGADCPTPVLPAFADLPEVTTLPDPFLAADGSGRDTSFAAWECRRNEILAEIQHYEVGQKPPRPDTLLARYDGDTLYVDLTHHGATLTLSCAVTLPKSEGPFPAVIGVGRGSGSLPAELFSTRGIATIAFNTSPRRLRGIVPSMQ